MEMKTSGIVAIAILGLLLASTFAIIPAPVVQAAETKLFDVTIIAPGNANLLRRQWGLIIANSFQAVGINANVVFLGWGSVYDRCLTPAPQNIGKTWSQGGYDMLLIGWTPGSPGTPFAGAFQIYYGANTPPGSNYFLWQNASADAAIETALTRGYTPQGIAAFKQWQMIQYQDLPASQIFFQSAVFSAAKTVNYNGYEWHNDNLGPIPQFITGVTSYTLASTGEPLDLLPPLSNSWYDTIVFSPVFDGLYTLDENFELMPALATALSVSADGYEYTYTLRQGVKFHDGVEMTADDVVFSWLAYMNPATGSQQAAYTAGYIGDDITFKWLNGTTTRLVLDLEAGTSSYPASPSEHGTRVGSVEAIDTYTVKVTIADFGGLGMPAATFHPEGEVGAILPKHILEAIPFEDWKSHPINTGQGTANIGNFTVKGPVGTGAYVYQGFNPATSLVTETKFNNYWNKTGLESIGWFGVTNYYVRYIVEKDAAIAALRNNEVQAIDQNYQLQRDYTAGNLNFANNYILEGSGLQQLGYNMRHPVFGTGVATPNGQADPANAAKYARYVRQAFDYLIPRDLIIQNLISGLGTPGAVHVNPLSPYLNTDCVPREFNPTKAKQLLALAGYETGIAPPGQVTPPAGQGTAGWMIGAPMLFTDKFDYAGCVTTLEESTDGGLTFKGVAMGVTDSNGYSNIYYAPNQTGNMTYRTMFTGIEYNTALDKGFTTPDFAWWTLPAGTAIFPATPGKTLQFVTTSPALVTAPQQAQIASMNATINSLSSTVNSQAQQINALNAAVGSLTTIAYVGVVLAIIALIVAIVAFMRKK